ncbi:methylenetetrahydrofolate reductase [Anderseniella sp. Alg231-50]|uniref:methylenetetrahydrofolate reductase n=1 Tax=Anderseniella sp. Alg231-50 TaxID=1922226 RepID=UPI000D55576C
MHQVLSSQSDVSLEARSIIDLMSGFTVETTPASAAKVADFRTMLRPGTTVYITFLPGSDYNDTVATAKRLRDEGFEPAPHFAARSIESVAMFEDYLARVAGEAGVDHVLAIAGALDKPLGPYSDSTQLLDTGLFDKHGIRQIGVAGHPEGSPDMSDKAIADALAWKNAYAGKTDAAMHIVTQFAFEAAPVIAWDKTLRAAGNNLPIRVGIPGLAKLQTLIKYAVACGVGNSINFLKKQAGNVTRLVSQQEPDQLVRDLAHYSATDPDCGIEGVHMYPLGGLQKSAQWSFAVADGAFELNRKGFKANP